MRWSVAALLAGGLVAALGVAGLVRGAGSPSVAGAPAAAPIVITNAYVRPPVPPNTTAAAYFTVYNTTSKPDVLETVVTGAGSSAVLHVERGGQMATVDGLPVPARSTVAFSAGGSHVMIGGLYGTLQAGQTVNLSLTFEVNGVVNVVAKVIAANAVVPGGS